MLPRLAVSAFLFALLLLGGFGATGTTAQESGWYDAGSGLTGENGQAFISGQVQFNPIDAGLTYARVTSGPCDGSPQEYVVYEVALMPEGGSGQVYVGVLEPIGRLAPPLRIPAGSYDVFLFGRGDQGGFTVVVDSQTPSVTFTACFRVP
jgi:hypothetical protein